MAHGVGGLHWERLLELEQDEGRLSPLLRPPRQLAATPHSCFLSRHLEAPTSPVMVTLKLV